MNKTQVYFKHKDGKSGDVRSIKTTLRPFNYENEMLEGRMAFNLENVDLFSDEFCCLCWRRTERFAMKIQMAKIASDKFKESFTSGKYFGEVETLDYDFDHIIKHADNETYNAALLIIDDLMQAYNFAVKKPSTENVSRLWDLLQLHAPNYVPTIVWPGTRWSVNILEMNFRVLEHLHVLRWAEDKIISLSSTHRKPNSTFCSEHNQLNQPQTGKSRRLYQRDLKHKKEFQAKMLEILRKKGIVKEHDAEWLETVPVSTKEIERIRKEAYASLSRRANSTTERIIKLNAEGKRQCEIVKELIGLGQLKEQTARQIVSNTLRREERKQDAIIEIKKLVNAGMDESKIANKFKKSVHTVTRLLEAYRSQ